MNNDLGVEVNALIFELQRLSAAIQKGIKGDLKAPARELVSAIQARAPKGKKTHSRYNKGIRKAGKGKGKVVATYKPGNLKRSFRILGKLRPMKAGVMVGPLLGGKVTDGYYAHFVEFGAANVNGGVRPARNFVESAVQSVGPRVTQAIADIIGNRITTVDKLAYTTGAVLGKAPKWAKLYARAKGRE